MSEHNPDQLTPEQIGTAKGWRLLNEDEYSNPSAASGSIERWEFGKWRAGYFVGADTAYTYRTRLSPIELRKARGLEEEFPLCKWCGRAKQSHVHPTRRCFHDSSEFYEPITEGGDEPCKVSAIVGASLVECQTAPSTESKPASSNAPAVVPPDATGATECDSSMPHVPIFDDEPFMIRDGEWMIRVAGNIVAATFNSRGAAEAGIETAKRRAQSKIINCATPEARQRHTELTALKAENERLKDRDRKQHEELSGLQAEHKDVLDCAVKDDPEGIDGINGWAKRIQAERDSLALQLAKMREDIEYAQKVLSNNGMAWKPQSLSSTSNQTGWVRREDMEKVVSDIVAGGESVISTGLDAVHRYKLIVQDLSPETWETYKHETNTVGWRVLALNMISQAKHDRATLRSQLATAEAERDARFDCHAGPGTTQDACGACTTCLIRARDDAESAANAMSCDLTMVGIERDQLATQLEEVKRELVGVARERDMNRSERQREGKEFTAQIEWWNTQLNSLRTASLADKARIEELEKALKEQHLWHLDQTERRPVYFEDTIGQIDADEYAESAMCEHTKDALSRHEKREKEKLYRSLQPDEVLLATDEMRRGYRDEYASSHDWFPMPKADVGRTPAYFHNSTFEVRRPIHEKGEKE